MQSQMIWGEPEASYIRRFFDGVDKVVTDEMQNGPSLREESLTFVLARLFDGHSTFQRILEYPEEEAKILKALEARMFSGGTWFGFLFPMWHLWHPELEYFIHKFWRRYPIGFPAFVPVTSTPDQLREERNKQLSSRPGLRVLGITSIGSIVKSNKTVRNTFRLEECYHYALSSDWFHTSGAVPFLPLSSFIVDLVLGCSRGSSDENIIRIAEGKEPEPPSRNEEDEAPGLAVRPTLKITVRSNLSQMDMRFHE